MKAKSFLRESLYSTGIGRLLRLLFSKLPSSFIMFCFLQSTCGLCVDPTRDNRFACYGDNIISVWDSRNLIKPVANIPATYNISKVCFMSFVTVRGIYRTAMLKTVVILNWVKLALEFSNVDWYIMPWFGAHCYPQKNTHSSTKLRGDYVTLMFKYTSSLCYYRQ